MSAPAESGRNAPLLNELYQEVILDHNRSPRNFGPLAGATSFARGVNPLCGDHYDVYVKRGDGVVRQVSFHGDGCAISKASASLMTVAMEGKGVDEVLALKDHFLRLLTDASASDADRQAVGRLKFLEGVRNFPVRVKCATLAWRALEEALRGGTDKPVTTETEGDVIG